jgi:hypothetical protein
MENHFQSDQNLITGTNGDISDFEVDDLIKVGSDSRFIKRIFENTIILKTNLPSIPANGTTVSKQPVSKVFHNNLEYFIDRDWTLENVDGNGHSTITFDDLAEFNVTRPLTVIGSYTFTNGSRIVSVSGGIDLKAEFSPRMWISPKDVFNTEWYEVLQIKSETEIEIRTAYTGTNSTSSGQKKNVKYFNDDSSVIINTLGKESNGAWIKTIPDAVQDILSSDLGLTNINTQSFSDANDDASYVASIAIPYEYNGKSERSRDVINDMNLSVFGSLVNDIDWNLRYNIISTDRDEDLEIIKDDDIIGNFTVNSKDDVARKIIGNYRPFDATRTSTEAGFQVYEFESDFTDRYIQTKKEKTIKIFLYDENAAETIVERFALMSQLTNSVVTIKSSLNLTLKELGQKMFVNFRRIYKRFGQDARLKIGIITSIKKTAKGTEVKFDDFSAMFNRVMSIAPDAVDEISTASDDEIAKYGFICDNTLEVPDVTSETEQNTQIIG